MPKDWWFAAFIVMLGLFVCSIIYITYLLKKKDQYTRERFAFAALTSLSASALTLISDFADKSTPWQMLGRLINQMKGRPPVQADAPHLADHILMSALWFGLLYLVVQVHKNWSGAISEQQYDAQRFHRPSSLIVDGIAEAKRVALRKEPFPLHAAGKQVPLQPVLLGNRETLAWHIQARDLLVLKNNYLDLQQSDWHPKAKCWIGREKQSFRAVAAYCESGTPDVAQIKEFIAYTQRLVKRSSFRVNETEYYLLLRNANASNVDIKHVTDNAIIIETENSLLEGLVDFSDYFQSIRHRVESSYLPDSTLRLPDTYVPTHATTEDKQTSGETEAFLNRWLKEKSERHIALLGEYGQGKSTTALMFAYEILSRPSHMTRVPILIELRGKSPKNMTPEDLLAGWAYPYRINPQAVMKLHQSGRIILILEGFDEIAQVSDPESRLAHFRTLWEFAGPDAKILITGRPNFFLDDAEMKVALGISETTATGPYCEALHLEPFNLDQIKAALRSCKASVRDGIVAMSSHDRKFREVVSRGSLLYVVSQLWERNKLASHRGPLTSARVLELFLDSSYQRQSQKAKNSPVFMVLNEAERRYFMGGIAAYMAAEMLPNQIDKRQFTLGVSLLYAAIPSSISRQVGGLQYGAGKPLRERLSGEEDACALVENDVRSSGILVVDQSKSGSLKFAHKSFMEFLVAKSYSDSLSIAGDEGASAIVSVTGLGPRMLIHSTEIMGFFAELISQSDDLDRLLDAEEMYQIIVVAPAKRTHIPSFLRIWMLFSVLLSASLSRRRRSIAKRKELEGRSSNRLIDRTVLMTPTFISQVALTGATGFLLTEAFKLSHNSRTNFYVAFCFYMVTCGQFIALRYLRRSTLRTNISLWLASCRLLGLGPEDVNISQSLEAIVLRKLLVFDLQHVGIF